MQFRKLLYKTALLAKFQAFNKNDLRHFSNKKTNFLHSAALFPRWNIRLIQITYRQ